MTYELEDVPCLLCHKPGWPWYDKPDKFLPHDRFRVVRCAQCGLAWVSPRPRIEHIGRYYPETYNWKPVAAGADSLVRRLERWYRFHLLRFETRQLLRHTDLKPGDAVLDVGCGSGDRLLAMRQAGLTPAGVDFTAAADYARETLQMDVRRGTLGEARFEDGRFRAVTLYNVMEHLHDPRDVLAEARRVLAPGGWLVIQVPNSGSVQARLFGPRWAAVDVPRDLYYWRPALLARLLDREGFDTAEVVHRTSFLHPPTAAISLIPWSDPQAFWQEEQQGNALAGIGRRLVWAATTVAAMLPAWVESMAGQGAIPTAFARRRAT